MLHYSELMHSLYVYLISWKANLIVLLRKEWHSAPLLFMHNFNKLSISQVQKTTKQMQRPRLIIKYYHIICSGMVNIILSACLGRKAITTICRQKPNLAMKNSHKLLNMSRVEIVLVLMSDGEYDSGLLIWCSCHGNTVGGNLWGMNLQRAWAK